MKGGKETKEVITFVLSHKETIESPMVTTFRNFFGFCKKSLNKCLRTTGTEYNVFSCHCRVAHHDGLQKPIHVYSGSETHDCTIGILSTDGQRQGRNHACKQSIVPCLKLECRQYWWSIQLVSAQFAFVSRNQIATYQYTCIQALDPSPLRQDNKLKQTYPLP